MYGWAQSQKLPISDLSWVEPEEFQRFDWFSMSEDQEFGYVAEVTLEYPEELHKLHSSFPVAAEKVRITEGSLSPYAKGTFRSCIFYLNHITGRPCKLISDCFKLLYGGGQEERKYKADKLTSTFDTRVKYVVHYLNLRLYLHLGLKLRKVHRVVKFRQTFFVKKYINICNKQRRLSQTEFGKQLWKNWSNVIYGKTIERVRDRLECRFLRDPAKAEKIISSNQFDSVKIISENLAVVYKKQLVVRLNKPYFIGFSILEHSKRFMYESFYYKILPKLGPSTRVLFSDTDSLALVTARAKISALDRLTELLDYSNYPKTHEKFSQVREGKLGYFKDELKSNTMLKYCGLRSKAYAYLESNSLNQSDILRAKCKGIRKGYLKKASFDDFHACVKTITKHKVIQACLRSIDHRVMTMTMNKLCFSSFDDKRFLFNCGKHSVPYGSVEITITGECPICVNVIRK